MLIYKHNTCILWTMSTEDEVRQSAGRILGLEGDTDEHFSGVGQLTKFSSFGFPGEHTAPDGWHIPKFDTNKVALVCEFKHSGEDISKQKNRDQLRNQMDVVMTRFSKVVGILYNGIDAEVFIGTPGSGNTNTFESPLKEQPKKLQTKEHYLQLFDVDALDKNRIYNLTKRINDRLHFDFRVMDLKHRMIFTACALVAKRYGAFFYEGMSFEDLRAKTISTLRHELAEATRQNQKLGVLTEVYSQIELGLTVELGDRAGDARMKKLVWEFVQWIGEISDCINSDAWAGEDVMGIFFNEFTRYKGKSEAGQVFTPEHMTDFVYRVLDVQPHDKVLDAACGSGGFLVKAMANMMKAAKGDEAEIELIKQQRLFGIEYDREIFALACANMLIHKDGKTNLENLDSRADADHPNKITASGKWIAEKGITKVLMNPPFENKYGCMQIVENILDSVGDGVDCAFILPDKKLEKDSKTRMKRILKNHRLQMVIKLPANLFFGVGTTTSLFVFKTGTPQNDQEFMACYMADDGLETVKNQGRHDVRGRWPDIRDEWIKKITRGGMGDATFQWNKPVIGEYLSWQEPKQEFSISEADFAKTALDYWAYQNSVDLKELTARFSAAALYEAEVETDDDAVVVKVGATDD